MEFIGDLEVVLEKFRLTSGVEVIPTSFHGCRFSDGTTFAPSDDQIAQIKSDWSCLTVKRDFSPVDLGIEGIGASESSQTMSDEGLKALDSALAENPNAIILVSFMVLSALKEQGIREKYPRVLAANATAETQRSAPAEKVWDTANFSY